MLRELGFGGGDDAGLDLGLAAARIDQFAALRFGFGDGQESLAQPFMKSPVHVFIPVLARPPALGAFQPQIQIDVQNQRQVRNQIAGNHPIEGIDQAQIDAVAVALCHLAMTTASPRSATGVAS